MESTLTQNAAQNTTPNLAGKFDSMNTPSLVEFSTKEESLQYPGVFDVTPTELNQKKSQVVIIDVREPDEFTGELGHIPGAQLISLNHLAAKSEKIPKDKTVVFVCRSGGRSGKATAWALGAGWSNVFNMKGGMLLWNDLHLPTEI